MFPVFDETSSKTVIAKFNISVSAFVETTAVVLVQAAAVEMAVKKIQGEHL